MTSFKAVSLIEILDSGAWLPAAAFFRLRAEATREKDAANRESQVEYIRSREYMTTIGVCAIFVKAHI
jgi:hypothetical protein